MAVSKVFLSFYLKTRHDYTDIDAQNKVYFIIILLFDINFDQFFKEGCSHRLSHCLLMPDNERQLFGPFHF